jgi:hypothetical protein
MILIVFKFKFKYFSNDYTAYKENSISYITNISNDFENLTSNLST